MQPYTARSPITAALTPPSTAEETPLGGGFSLSKRSTHGSDSFAQSDSTLLANQFADSFKLLSFPSRSSICRGGLDSTASPCTPLQPVFVGNQALFNSLRQSVHGNDHISSSIGLEPLDHSLSAALHSVSPSPKARQPCLNGHRPRVETHRNSQSHNNTTLDSFPTIQDILLGASQRNQNRTRHFNASQNGGQPPRYNNFFRTRQPAEGSPVREGSLNPYCRPQNSSADGSPVTPLGNNPFIVVTPPSDFLSAAPKTLSHFARRDSLNSNAGDTFSERSGLNRNSFTLQSAQLGARRPSSDEWAALDALAAEVADLERQASPRPARAPSMEHAMAEVRKPLGFNFGPTNTNNNNNSNARRKENKRVQIFSPPVLSPNESFQFGTQEYHPPESLMQKANDPEDDAALVTLLKSISSLAEGEDNCLSSVGTSTNEAEGPHINSKANLSSSNPKIDQLLRDLGKSFHGISVNEEDVKKLVSHESKATPRDEEGWSPVKLDDL